MEPTQMKNISVSLEDINNMNIIINDSNCMDEFINSVCQELEVDGFKFTYTSDCQDIDVDNGVIITLDQQYMAGPATGVFAPLENGTLGDSDALAIACEKAFIDNDVLVDGIHCGQMGFRENEDGSISERVPTPVEEVMGKFTIASYVTISLGTSNSDPVVVAHSLETALARYCSYTKNNSTNIDLIYCVEDGQGYDDIANILGCSSNELDTFNRTSDEKMLLAGETIINPLVGEIREFDETIPVVFKDNRNHLAK